MMEPKLSNHMPTTARQLISNVISFCYAYLPILSLAMDYPTIKPSLKNGTAVLMFVTVAVRK
jgi:hypothetical protein